MARSFYSLTSAKLNISDVLLELSKVGYRGCLKQGGVSGLHPCSYETRRLAVSGVAGINAWNVVNNVNTANLDAGCSDQHRHDRPLPMHLELVMVWMWGKTSGSVTRMFNLISISYFLLSLSVSGQGLGMAGDLRGLLWVPLAGQGKPWVGYSISPQSPTHRLSGTGEQRQGRRESLTARVTFLE